MPPRQPRPPIILISSRERVERAIHYAFVLGGTLGGMVAAGLASPVILGSMSGAMLGMHLYIKFSLNAHINLLKPSDLPDDVPVAIFSKRVAFYSRLLGLKTQPSLKVIHGIERTAATGKLKGQDLIFVSTHNFLKLFRPELKWTAAHEVAHCARRDYSQFMVINAGIASAAGLLVSGVGALTSGLGLTMALPFLGAAAAQFSIPLSRYLKVRQIQDGRYTANDVPHLEFEAERVAASLLRQPFPADEFSYQISFQDMANHCARYDLPQPPHLPPPDRQPGRLTKAYNRLCGFLVRPLLAPPVGGLALRHSVRSNSFQ